MAEVPVWSCQSCQRPLLFDDGPPPPEAVELFRAAGFPLLDAAQSSGLLELEDRVLTSLAEAAALQQSSQKTHASQDDWGQLNSRRQAAQGGLPPSVVRASTLGPAALQQLQHQQQQHQQMDMHSGRRRGPGQGGPSSGFAALQSRPSAAANANAEQQRIRAQSALFELAMDKAQVDEPLCPGCTEKAAEELQRRVRQAESELAVLEAGLASLRGTAAAPKKPGSGVKEEAKRASEAGPPAVDQEMSAAEADALAAEELRLLEEERSLDLLERRLVEGLGQADLEERQLLRELRQLDRENMKLAAEEREFMKGYQKYQLDRDELLDEQTRIKQSIRVAEQQLEELKRTNVVDDAFHIRTEGAFGTINGFRMGRLDSQPVGWTEINAALGQAVLLLDCLAVRARLRFSRYGLLAMGSWSKMYEVADPSVTFELYGGHWDLRDSIEGSAGGKFSSPGRGGRGAPAHLPPQSASPHAGSLGVAAADALDTGLPPDYRSYATGGDSGGKLSSSGMKPKSWFAAPRFDVALVMFLQCVDELQRFFASRDEHYKPPYETRGDRIGGFSIKLQYSSDEEWTTACRYLLTNLQYALLASMRYERRHREQQLRRTQALRAQR